MDDEDESVALEEEDQLHSLKNKVQLINKNVIGKKSREVYIGKQIAFLNWLDETHPSLLSPQFRETAERDSKGVLKRAFVKQLLIDAVPPAPVLLEKIDAEVISLFVASLKKTDGTAVGSSTHNTTRSSLRDLFRAYKCMDLAESMNTSLSNFFKGLKRTTAQAQGRGVGKIQVGKTPLDFSLYCFLAARMLRSSSSNYIFAHLYLLLSWNLMCRAANTASICFSHMEWRQDALGIYFAHMKNDQSGERPKDPRHVYSTPLKPEICVLLSLGIFLLCFPFQKDQNFLFSGSKQYDRQVSLLACWSFVFRCLCSFDD